MKRSVFILGLMGCFFVSAIIGFDLFNRFYYPVPKIIHYVWIGGGQLPNRAQEAIASWKKYAPDYEIKLWNEESCDINANLYVKEAYRTGQYRFVADWCRFNVLYNEGGIYFDVDHYLHGNIDDLRKTNLSFSFEDKFKLAVTGIAAAKHQKLIKNIIEFYEQQNKFTTTVAPILLTPLVFDFYPSLNLDGSFQRLGHKITLWPTNYYIIDFGGPENKATHRYYNSYFGKEYGTYYEVFKNAFLNGRAYRLQKFNQTDYLIPTMGDSWYNMRTLENYKLHFLNDACFELVPNAGEKETYCWAHGNTYDLQTQ